LSRQKAKYPTCVLVARVQPSHYLGHLLGHEGRGSLLAELKRRGWANTIVAGEQDGARGFSTFHMAVDLTEAGLANSERVVELAFRYLAMLREAGPRREVHDELRDLSTLRFRFKDKENPVSYATHLASALHYYPLKEVLSADFLLEQYDPPQIETLLVYLTPDNCRYMVVSKDFAGKTDQKEKWYGTEYSKTPFSPSVLENLRASSPEPSLHLPAPNPFIPKRLDLLEREPDNVQLPRLLIDSNSTRLWYKQDNHYLLPKAMTMLEIVSPVPYSSPHTVNCLSLSLSLISDHLNEYTYDAELAGLNFSLDSSHHGLALKVGGYNDKLPVLLDKLLETILSFKINPERFAILREVYERSLKNQAANQPYTHALYYSTYALSEVQWSFEEKLAVFDELTQPALEAFLKEFLGHLFVECLFYGNLTKLTGLELVDALRKRLTNAGTRTLLPQQMRRFREVQVPNDGVSYVYRRKNKVHPSNSIDMLLQVGPERLEDCVRLNLLAHLFSEPFFNKLRTDEQLGD
jgi:insulysin